MWVLGFRVEFGLDRAVTLKALADSMSQLSLTADLHQHLTLVSMDLYCSPYIYVIMVISIFCTPSFAAHHRPA